MKQNIELKKEQILFGNDSIAIVKYLAGVPGGRTLDLTDYKENVVNAGHVIITTKKDGETVYKPLEITSNGGTAAYKALAAGEAYAGVLYRSILKENPAAAIMTMGVVNSKLLPAPLPTGFPAGITCVEDINA